MIFVAELKSIATYVKNNLSIIIIIPAFIGGTWQALELMNISFPFIRFFSISQIVPDGLVILMSFIVAIGPMIISGIVGYHYGSKTNSERTVAEWSTEEKNKFLKESATLNKIIFLLSVLISICLYIMQRKYNVINGDIGNFYIYIVFLVAIYNLAYQSLNALNYSSKVISISELRLAKVTFIFLLFLSFFSICREVHNNFLLNKNFINIQQVEKTLSKNFPNSKKELLYFNDKYIFYKITDSKLFDKNSIKTNEEIYILELNEIFKEEEKKL